MGQEVSTYLFRRIIPKVSGEFTLAGHGRGSSIDRSQDEALQATVGTLKLTDLSSALEPGFTNKYWLLRWQNPNSGVPRNAFMPGFNLGISELDSGLRIATDFLGREMASYRSLVSFGGDDKSDHLIVLWYPDYQIREVNADKAGSFADLADILNAKKSDNVAAIQRQLVLASLNDPNSRFFDIEWRSRSRVPRGAQVLRNRIEWTQHGIATSHAGIEIGHYIRLVDGGEDGKDHNMLVIVKEKPRIA